MDGGSCMEPVYFLLLSIGFFLLSLIGYKKFKSITLYSLAIGGLVNSNYYHSMQYPINCFGLTLGIDSIIYVLFVFCVVVMYFKEGKKAAISLSISSILAIVVAATMQLCADLISDGSSLREWNTFFTFLSSAFASVVSVFVLVKIFDKIKVNDYLKLVICIFIVAFVNSIIYYPLYILINGWTSEFANIIVGNVIGKFVAIFTSLIPFFFMNKMDKKIK